MQNPDNYKRFAILYVDDEEMSLKYFKRAFEDQFWILTAANAQDGLKLLEEHKDKIAILITDQKMPGEKGVWLLEKSRQIAPRIIRIMATAYAELTEAIEAVNTGSIFKYISKPWDPPHLEETLRLAFDLFVVQEERDSLLKEKMSILHNRMIAEHVVRLGLLAAGMSHHVRNSLVSVKTFIDLAPSKMLEEKSDKTLRNPDFWHEYHREVQAQLERINNMLRDLWVASERPSAEFSDRVHLHEIIRDVLKKLEGSFAERKLKIENKIPDSLPSLLVDAHKFSRLFELLLRDEVVSLPAGSEIQLSASSQGGQVEVQISDNGPGLPQAELQLVFDPFAIRTDTPTEYGINLMTCFFIVHHHGGTIEARSEGKGTTFILRLPTNPSRPPVVEENTTFLQKILSNDAALGKLSASDQP